MIFLLLQKAGSGVTKEFSKATKVDIFCRFGQVVSTGFRKPVHMGFLKLFLEH
jgi:hypothetical protein